MNHCIYESMTGRSPECNGACSLGKKQKCQYYFIDEVYNTIAEWKREAGVNTPILWNFDYKRNKVCFYTTKPGYMIGKAGVLYNKYIEKLRAISITGEVFQNGIDMIECKEYV